MNKKPGFSILIFNSLKNGETRFLFAPTVYEHLYASEFRQQPLDLVEVHEGMPRGGHE